MTKCIKCGGLSHFQASKLCPERSSKQATARKLEEAGDSDNEVSEESCGRIMEDSISVGKVEAKKKNSILCKLKVTGPGEGQNWAKINVATDTGVRKTILRRSDWERIKDQCKLVKTKLKFRPYGTNVRLPIRGRAKVKLRAEAGAVINTYVYVNDDNMDSSLLGEKDALRLGIVKINLKGSTEEVPWEEDMAQEEDESVRRIRQNRLSELLPAKMSTREVGGEREVHGQVGKGVPRHLCWRGEIQRPRN